VPQKPKYARTPCGFDDASTICTQSGGCSTEGGREEHRSVSLGLAGEANYVRLRGEGGTHGQGRHT